MKTDKSIAHVIVNNLGGITSLVQNLMLYKGDEALQQELYLLDISGNRNAPAMIDERLLSVAEHFAIHPSNNWYYSYGKLAKLLSKNKGVLVSNDQYDLVMLEAFNIPRKVVQLVHDPYNVNLSLRFHHCIDLFIAHSKYIYEELLKGLPDRQQDIVHLPYGIPLQETVEKKRNETGPLKLLFLGRHEKPKGVFDLFAIHQFLQEMKIPVEWTILGRGPETAALQQQWENEKNIRFHTPVSSHEIFAEALQQDVLVFPTKFEGFPVALLETMSMGCVPVVTDLPGGIRELVQDAVTGFKCAIDDNLMFAEKIAFLHSNREQLFAMQLLAVEKVSAQYNAVFQAPKYQAAFMQTLKNDKAPRHHAVHLKIGSRLDQPWLPNFVTRSVRSLR